MVEITLTSVSKSFETDFGDRAVLAGIDLAVKRGEVLALRGDNGTGKTTLLNIVAGLEAPTDGSISFGDTRTGRPNVGFAQQDYAASLLPWFNTIENIALPLKLDGTPWTEREQRATALLKSLSFSNLPEDAYPHELSGGQKQRVAVSRALIREPEILLLDEPFANLDAHTVRDLQNVLFAVHAAQGPTIIFASHEIGHCLLLADRIVVLRGSPSTVALDFRVNLPRPRTREIMQTREYAAMRAEILDAEERLYATT